VYYELTTAGGEGGCLARTSGMGGGTHPLPPPLIPLLSLLPTPSIAPYPLSEIHLWARYPSCVLTIGCGQGGGQEGSHQDGFDHICIYGVLTPPSFVKLIAPSTVLLDSYKY
jgi:hypothetical protein